MAERVGIHWLAGLVFAMGGAQADAHDTATEYAGEPLVHVTFDGTLSNGGTYPAQPRMVEVGGEPSAAAPAYAGGRFGQAIRFQGDRILELPIDITRESYPQVTVTGWVYIDAENTTGSTGILLSNGSFLTLQLYGGRLVMKTGKSASIQFTSEVVPRHRWVFFAGVWDSASNQGTAYVDQRVETGDLALETTATPDRSVWVGTHKVSSSSILNGMRIECIPALLRRPRSAMSGWVAVLSRPPALQRRPGTTRVPKAPPAPIRFTISTPLPSNRVRVAGFPRRIRGGPRVPA